MGEKVINRHRWRHTSFIIVSSWFPRVKNFGLETKKYLYYLKQLVTQIYCPEVHGQWEGNGLTIVLLYLGVYFFHFYLTFWSLLITFL